MKLGTASAVDDKQNNCADALMIYLRRRPWGPILGRIFAHCSNSFESTFDQNSPNQLPIFNINMHMPKEHSKEHIFASESGPNAFGCRCCDKNSAKEGARFTARQKNSLYALQVLLISDVFSPTTLQLLVHLTTLHALKRTLAAE